MPPLLPASYLAEGVRRISILLTLFAGKLFNKEARSVALNFTSLPLICTVAGVLLLRYTLPSWSTIAPGTFSKTS